MYKLGTDGYAAILNKCWDKKIPLFVYGGPGIGKSEIPRQVFSKVASEMKKEFRLWEDCTFDQKKEMIQNADKYFVFCDQRVGQMDVTDLRGVPNLTKGADMLETLPFSWVIYFTQEKAHGVIFFDELNLAAPVVAGSAYQIINDRTIADRRLGKDVFVFGAGNRAEDQAQTFDMPLPLRDRFCEFEITPNVQAWTEWAAGKVNPHLVAFINWKEAYLYHVDKNAANKSSTPRGIVRASRLLDGADITTNEAFEMVSISVGEGFAAQFQAYCKHFKSLNWTQIYKNPESVQEFEADKLWAVVGGITEQFNKENDQDLFDKQMGVVMVIRPEFAIVCLRMMKDGDKKKFLGSIKKCKQFKVIVDKYAKYVVTD